MRTLLFALAASSIALTSCGEKQAAGNMSGPDQVASAKELSNDDITSIDAATGADANMAADVDINAVADTDDGSRPANGTRAKPRPQAQSTSNNSTESVPEPIVPANSTANSTD